MTSKVRKKRKNFKINRKGGRFQQKKAEDLPLYWKTWQVLCLLQYHRLYVHNRDTYRCLKTSIVCEFNVARMLPGEAELVSE